MWLAEQLVWKVIVTVFYRILMLLLVKLKLFTLLHRCHLSWADTWASTLTLNGHVSVCLWQPPRDCCFSSSSLIPNFSSILQHDMNASCHICASETRLLLFQAEGELPPPECSKDAQLWNVLASRSAHDEWPRTDKYKRKLASWLRQMEDGVLFI